VSSFHLRRSSALPGRVDGDIPAVDELIEVQELGTGPLSSGRSGGGSRDGIRPAPANHRHPPPPRVSPMGSCRGIRQKNCRCSDSEDGLSGHPEQRRHRGAVGGSPRPLQRVLAREASFFQVTFALELPILTSHEISVSLIRSSRALSHPRMSAIDMVGAE